MSEINLRGLSNNLELKDGIWYSRTKAAVSYPDDGNEICYQIEDDSFWFKHRNDCIMGTINNFPPHGIFYDVGGGNGYIAQEVQKNGYETVLVEPGIKGIMNAKQRGLKNLICSTLEDADFNKNSIGAIGIFDVIEHIGNDKKFLSSLKEYLIEGGRLYITAPSYKVLWSKEDKEAGHFKRYTIKSLSKILEGSGFVVEYSTYFFSFLPFPIFLFRTLPSMLGFKRHNQINKCQKEHNPQLGIINSILNKIWKIELEFIKNKKKIPFGSSCLIVARII